MDEGVKSAMNWVIPEDSSPGAGQDCVLAELIRIVGSVPPSGEYWRQLSRLEQVDLDDVSNAFAQTFKGHVLDAYYATRDSGAWQDIGFRE